MRRIKVKLARYRADSTIFFGGKENVVKISQFFDFPTGFWEDFYETNKTEKNTYNSAPQKGKTFVSKSNKRIKTKKYSGRDSNPYGR